MTFNPLPGISPAKYFIKEQQRIAIRDMWSNDKPHTHTEKGKRGVLWTWEGLLEETASSKYSDFSVLNYGSLPLAELFQGQEESFLPPAVIVMWHHFLSEMQGLSPLLGVSWSTRA